VPEGELSAEFLFSTSAGEPGVTVVRLVLVAIGGVRLEDIVGLVVVVGS
jgi:predicted aspartyl protease